MPQHPRHGAGPSSVEVTWELDGITMRGTVERPGGGGPVPAVVLVAGSGPTDRDWCSPGLPGTHGSGALLARALAEAGIASLRYDKRASGPDAAAHAAELTGRVSMRSHLDELVAAVAVLAAQEDVDATRIAGLGSSEGTLHLLHHATGARDVPLVGLVLVAPPGRSVAEVLVGQLKRLLAPVPAGAELLETVRAGVARYQAGGPLDLDPRLPPGVAAALASFEAPPNLPLARELMAEHAGRLLPEVGVPTLVVIGGKDVQVDVAADGGPLQAAATGTAAVTFAFPPDANHVLKHDGRPLADVVAAPGTGYNEPGTRLDPEALATILGWLRGLLAPV